MKVEEEEEKEDQIRPLYWSESLKNTGYNIKFKAMTYLEQLAPTRLIRPFEEVFLLGIKYTANPDNLEKVNQQIYAAFCSIPWMTYRAIFPEMDTCNKTYVTDTGWGCMVRVGQMLMAQAFKRHLDVKTKQGMMDILKLFSDYDQDQMFSIQNISKMARQQYELPPGKWYNPSQISYILSDLYKYQEGNQYRDSLQFLVLNNATLFYDQILQAMCGIKQLCKCTKKQVVCYKCYKKQKSVCLILLARIGLQAPEKKYLSVANQMMETRLFQGMIGGKPEKALYFVGRNFDQYVYLDPHNVQEGVSSKNLQRLVDTYFCKSYRCCKNTSIDPSVGMSFFLGSLEDVDELYLFMKRLKETEPEDFFLFSAIDTPEYMRSTQERGTIQTGQTQTFETL